MTIPKILLYYVLTPIPDPEAVRLWQRELCHSLGLRGRIIVSTQGINGTVGGEMAACKQYLKRTREYAPFHRIKENVKWSEGTGFADLTPIQSADKHLPPWRQIVDFPRLSVKVRDELVGFGAPTEVKVGAEGVIGGGTHLSPQQVNELVAQRGDDVVFFDGRNAYEANIGKFRNAVIPNVRTSHGFIEQLESGIFDDIKDRPIISYCTGGIRCEFLSVLMKNRGFTEVYQIDGGIVRYGEAFGNDGLWDGSLAVFDGRETMDFAPGAKIIGRCEVCGHQGNQLTDCTGTSCKSRFVVCPDHATSDQVCTVHVG